MRAWILNRDRDAVACPLRVLDQGAHEYRYCSLCSEYNRTNAEYAAWLFYRVERDKALVRVAGELYLGDWAMSDSPFELSWPELAKGDYWLVLREGLKLVALRNSLGKLLNSRTVSIDAQKVPIICRFDIPGFEVVYNGSEFFECNR